MEIDVLEIDSKRVRFLIKGVETPIMNALRRIMISEVPSMMIEEVVIIENSSPMKDEDIAHRLGFVPLKTDLESYVLPEDCTCHSELGCEKCSAALTLEAEAQDSTRTIYSKELKSNNTEVIPVSDEIPLLKLARGQKIRLEAYAKLGRGITHAKWQPVSASTYKYVPTIKIDIDKCNQCGKCVETCIKQVFKVEKKVLITDYLKCNLCKECVKECRREAIEINRLENAFVFIVESVGGLPPERIFLEATKILKTKTEDLVTQLTEVKEGESE